MGENSIIDKIKEEAKVLKEAQKTGTPIDEIVANIEKEKKIKEKQKKANYEKILEQRAAEETQIILDFLHQSEVVPDEDYVFFSIFGKFKRVFAESKIQIIVANTLTELEEKIQKTIRENTKSKIFIHTIAREELSRLKKLNEKFADIYNFGRIGTVEIEEDDDEEAELLKPRTYKKLPINYHKIEEFWVENHNGGYSENSFYTYLKIPIYNEIKFIRLIEIL